MINKSFTTFFINSVIEIKNKIYEKKKFIKEVNFNNSFEDFTAENVKEVVLIEVVFDVIDFAKTKGFCIYKDNKEVSYTLSFCNDVFIDDNQEEDNIFFDKYNFELFKEELKKEILVILDCIYLKVGVE